MRPPAIALHVHATPARRLAIFPLAALLVACSRMPPAPTKPKFDADAAGAQAIELYDKNGDALLDAGELKLVPGIAEGMARVDTDADGRVSAAEIAKRVEHWSNSKTRINRIAARVLVDQRAVPGLEVNFEPEPFLAQWITAGRGKTDDLGVIEPLGATSHPGMNLGYYKIKVSRVINGKETLPARYNERTELGAEITDDRNDASHMIELRLKSR